MTQPLPNPPSAAVSRLLHAARRPETSPKSEAPTLHERRLEGLEAAQRLQDRPRPR